MRSAVRSWVWVSFLLVAFGWATSASAGGEVDNVNGNLSPPFLVWGTDQAGWVYTPRGNFLLDGIYSTFRNVGASSQNGPILRRDVTLSVQEGDRNGALLARAQFSADASAGNLGANFTPVLLLAGKPYFISYANLLNLGLNIVDWNINAASPQQPAGTVNLDGWYTGSNFATFYPRFINGALQVFSAPILRLQGTPVSFGSAATECLLNWAERNYPGLFAPAGAVTSTFQNFTFRYYAGTRIYVGVSGSDGNVYYMGTDGVMHNVGPLPGWLQLAACPG